MKITRQPTLNGSIGLAFEPTDYDAHISHREVRLDLAQSSISADRALVSAVLLHGGISSTDFQMDAEVSATCASAVSRFLRPETSTIGPVSFHQRPFPAGSLHMEVHDGLPAAEIAHAPAEGGRLQVHLLAGGNAAGSLMVGNRIYVAGNVLARATPSMRERFLLASAVMVAEELHAGIIEPRFECETRQYRDLLVSCGLALMPAAPLAAH